MRRLLYVHSAIHALLRSVQRPISTGLADRRLTLLVRISIAQYVDDINRFISRHWLNRPDFRLPTLCLDNAASFLREGLIVESSSGPTWGRRNINFMRILETSNVTSKSLTFLRVLNTIRTELSLSDDEFKRQQFFITIVIIYLFCRDCHSRLLP